MESDLYKDYLRDLVTILREYAEEAKHKKLNEKSKSEFHSGYLMGFHRIFTLMQQQAIGFRIPLDEIGLANFDPDKELIL